MKKLCVTLKSKDNKLYLHKKSNDMIETKLFISTSDSTKLQEVGRIILRFTKHDGYVITTLFNTDKIHVYHNNIEE